LFRDQLWAFQSFTGRGTQIFGGFFNMVAELSTKAAAYALPTSKAVGN
jgi:RES domain-containing protein